MRARRPAARAAAALAAVGMVLVGCSDEGAIPSSDTDDGPGEQPAPLSPDVLLRPADVPGGFSAESDSASDAFEVITPFHGIAESLRPGCADAADFLAARLDPLPPGSVGTTFSAERHVLAEVVVPEASEQEAGSLVAQIDDFVDACDVATAQTKDLGSVSIVLRELPLPGDGTNPGVASGDGPVVAWTRTIVVTTQSREDALLAAATGSRVVLLGATGIDPLDATELVAIAETALDRAGDSS